MVTVADVLALPVLSEASLVAGRRGLGAAVRWTHVAEVLDIARLLEGGELLLTTGIALDVPPERQRSYIQELKERKVAGVMLELGRRFDQVPPALVEAANEVGLPLIALPFDTRFVKVTEAVHRELISTHQGSAASQLLEELLQGHVRGWAELLPRLTAAGVSMPEPASFCAAVHTGPPAQPLPSKPGSVRGLLSGGDEVERLLLCFGTNPGGLSEAIAAWARTAGPRTVIGIGRCYRDLGSVGRTVAEARQAAAIRRRHPHLDPRIDRMGAYALLPHLEPAVTEAYVRQWIGPLLEFEASHPGPLLETLRVLLDEGPVAGAARRLYISRQALYSRRDRIASLLGVDLDDAEVRLALALALRLHEGLK